MNPEERASRASLDVLEAAAPRLKNRLHLAKRGCVSRQRYRRVKVVDAVMLHAENEDVAKGAGEETRVSVAALFVGRMMRRPAEEKRDVARADVTRQPPDQCSFERIAAPGQRRQDEPV